MEIHVEEIGPCKAKVSVAIPPTEVDEALERTYRQTAQTVAFPGFRKGKAPKKLIQKRFGDLIYEDVKEKLVQEVLTEAMEKHDLKPAADPDIDLASIDVKEDTAIEFSFEVETHPTFDLGEYKGLSAEVAPLQVTDADIDEEVMALRSRFAFLNSVPDQPVDKKHYLTVDLTYKIEGEEDLEREGSQVNISLGILDGIEAGKAMDALLGKKKDEEVEIEIPSLPPHFQPEKLRGKAAKVKVAIKDIREVAFPEVDADFLKKIEMKSLEELREKIHEEVQEQKKSRQTDEIERKLMDQLIEKHPFEIPEKVLMEQISRQEKNLKYEMLRMGMPQDKIEEQAQKFDEKNRAEAERNLRANFIYEKIADKENIYVTENEIHDELSKIARQQKQSLQEVKKQYEEGKLAQGLKSFLRNQKIRKLLRESANITEIEGEASSQEVDAPSQEGATPTTEEESSTGKAEKESTA